MTKTDQIQHAIHEANLYRSKLSPEALQVPGFTSLKIRHLMNNLGAISKNYLDCGSHRGGSYCSTVFKNDNLESTICIDDFREFSDGNPMHDLLSNAGTFKPSITKLKLISKDCWIVTASELPLIDLYLYDSDHSMESQEKAVTFFNDSMIDEFIFCVDDYGLGQVKEGTLKGLNTFNQQGGQILFEQEFYSTPEIANESWHQGFYIALLKK